ncbi:neuronal growth regulator 1-like isoform X2 [Ostrea edulis]|nr:neuronal growth regulator 1-like isoform X2 [Ostrea edulis]
MNPRGTVITRDVTKVTDDIRISIERKLREDWNILIRNISYQDRGDYSCIVNTVPIPQIKRVHLHVNVPPSIIDYASSRSGMYVREGETVQLVCNATGYPPPRIHWFRNKHINVTNLPGDTLIIRNITRHCAGEYECRANNGLPMEASRVFRIIVQFAPEVNALVPRLGITLGSETVLQCSCAASPIGICEWRKDGRDLHISGKYEPNTYKDDPETITLSLTIFHIRQEDLGLYECHAKNLMGEDSDYTDLYVYKSPIPSTSPPIPTTKFANPGSRYRTVKTNPPRNPFANPFPDESFVVLRPSTIKTPSKYSADSNGSRSGVYRHLVIVVIGLHTLLSRSL